MHSLPTHAPRGRGHRIRDHAKITVDRFLDFASAKFFDLSGDVGCEFDDLERFTVAIEQRVVDA